MTFGERVKQERTEKGIGRTELARLSGVTLRTLENWEYKKTIPNDIKNIIAVCEVLEIDLNDIKQYFID